MAGEKQDDAEHSSASLVGAPPYDLPLDVGGQAAVVGHPEPPTNLSETPVRGDTDGLDAPHMAEGGAEGNVDPVLEDVITAGEDNEIAETVRPDVTEPTRHAKITTPDRTPDDEPQPAKKATAKRTTSNRK